MKLPVRKEGVNTCMTWCVSKYFGIPPNRVPFFIGSKNWRSNFESFFSRRGKKIELFYYSKKRLPKRGICFVVGLSHASKAKTNNPHDMRNLHHVVLYKNGKPWYDPNYRKGRPFLKGKPHFIWLIKDVSS